MDIKTNYTLIGDVREKLKELPDKSIQMCVTSPPYWALRNYDDQEKQLGLEKTPEEFIKNLVDVFAEVHRVLRDDGTLWLNLGDTYSSQRWAKKGSFTTDAQPINNFKDTHRAIAPEKTTDLPPKSLVGIPWKVAIALQEWGWILRQDIIWAKKNCMPESVKDRFTKNHEYIFLFSKQPKYFFNQVLEPVKNNTVKKRTIKGSGMRPDEIKKLKKGGTAGYTNNMRNKRSVWNMRTASYKEAHFAVFPPELAETCIKAGCPEKICSECGTPYKKVVKRKKLNIKIEKSESERFSVNLKNNHRKIGGQYDKELKKNPLIDKGLQKQCDCKTDETKAGIVLDCFMGSGTTAMVAQNLFRKWIGVELNPEYEKLIRKRTAQQVLF
tara:strand:+ start:402 stop:1547 length:1146 start_codon:yes stop_codon:yes gene_type:complete